MHSYRRTLPSQPLAQLRAQDRLFYILLASAIVIATLLASALHAPRRAYAQDEAATTSLPPEAQEIVHAINRIRLANGLNALAAHALLNQAAQDHVDDLIANGMYGHYGSDGSNLRTRVARTGYPSLWVSENWVTSASVDGAMNWWMNDWIHRVNILDASWDEVGVGVGMVSNGYRIYVTDFANADGKDTSVAVAPAAQAASAAPVAAAAVSVPASGMDYTVRAGDTLMAIGVRHGIDWQDIAIANALGEFDILSIGKVLRIPGIGAPAASSAVAADGRLYTVRAGDTLSGIAGRFGIAWDDIAAANRLGEYTVLQIGMQLRLPGVPEEGAEANAESEAQSDANAATASTSAATGGFASDSGTIRYSVEPGDTLISIAARNQITWQALASLNGMNENSVLQIGQAIVLPAPVAASAAVATPLATPAPATPAAAPVAAQQINNAYTATSGGAPAHALPASTPAAAGLNYTTELLPAPSAPGTSGSGATYTVRAGDTVIGIATRLGVNWQRLLEVNGLRDNSVLQLGQVLQLP